MDKQIMEESQQELGLVLSFKDWGKRDLISITMRFVNTQKTKLYVYIYEFNEIFNLLCLFLNSRHIASKLDLYLLPIPKTIKNIFKFSEYLICKI